MADENDKPTWEMVGKVGSRNYLIGLEEGRADALKEQRNRGVREGIIELVAGAVAGVLVFAVVGGITAIGSLFKRKR